jgi:hypothetical protein
VPCLLQKRHFISVFIFIAHYNTVNWTPLEQERSFYEYPTIHLIPVDSDVRDSEVRDFDVREGSVGLNREYPTLLYLFTVQSDKTYCSRDEQQISPYNSTKLSKRRSWIPEVDRNCSALQRSQCTETWHRVVWQLRTKVSEKPTAFIFRNSYTDWQWVIK